MARKTLTLNADGTLDGVQMAIVNKRMEAICAQDGQHAAAHRAPRACSTARATSPAAS